MRRILWTAATVLILMGRGTAWAQGPAASEGWVVLPVDDYAAIRRAAFPGEVKPAPPAVEATLTRIDYDLKVDGELASGEAHLTVDVIKDGWVRVAIPRGLMVQKARLDGRRVSLVTDPAGGSQSSSYLLLSKPGRSVFDIEIAAPVSTVAGTDILELPTGNSSIARAAIVLPRQGFDVHVSGGLLLEKSETATESRFVANGQDGAVLTFAWKRKTDDQRSTQPLRLRGALTELVGLGEDTTQVITEVQIDVLQGTAQDVKLALPDQFAVNQVSGPTVADWDAAPGSLSVTFIEPVQQSARFTVNGEIRLPRDGKIDVPMVRIEAAERETGGIAVEVVGAGEIKGRRPAGMDEAEAADLGQLISSRQSPSLVAFKLEPAEGGSARSLSIDVARYTPQAILTANVEEARYSLLLTDDGKLLVNARLAIRNNQRNFLKVTLPHGSDFVERRDLGHSHQAGPGAGRLVPCSAPEVERVPGYGRLSRRHHLHRSLGQVGSEGPRKTGAFDSGPADFEIGDIAALLTTVQADSGCRRFPPGAF